MPVYHFVLHAYGSWHPDHPEGWHQHGVGRPLLPSEALGQYRRGRQRWPSAEFSPVVHAELSDMARDICLRRAWRCHAVAVNQTHVHIVGSWRGALPEPLDAQAIFKRLLGWRLSNLTGVAGRSWFCDGGLPKPVVDGAHLQYLLDEYLPGQGGHCWREPRSASGT